ncbi:hypothetical protein G3N92_12225 [Burkholderia sp. Ac-20379]|nr:hypothetical protein [Burkholderia sp. Ac-20379]
MSVDDASLLAYVDGSLQAPEHDRIAAAIEQSEALARRAAELIGRASGRERGVVAV